VGGIKKLYATNLDWITSFTEGTDEVFTDVTMASFAITAVAVGAGTEFTAAGHDFVVGDLVFINGTVGSITGITPGDTHAVTAVTSTTFTIGDLTTGGTDTGATLTADRGWFEFQFDKSTSSVSGDFTVSNGNRFYTPTVTVLITPADNSTRKIVRQLALAYTVWAAECNDGTIKIFFDENGGQASAIPYTSGVAAGDYAGFTVTITGEEDDPFRIYDDTTNALPVFAFL
jgi:hypothetical protein